MTIKRKRKPTYPYGCRIETDISYVEQRPGEEYIGWCWTVHLNGRQYASEILPEKSFEDAIRAVNKYVRKARKHARHMKRTSYFVDLTSKLRRAPLRNMAACNSELSCPVIGHVHA